MQSVKAEESSKSKSVVFGSSLQSSVFQPISQLQNSAKVTRERNNRHEQTMAQVGAGTSNSKSRLFMISLLMNVPQELALPDLDERDENYEIKSSERSMPLNQEIRETNPPLISNDQTQLLISMNSQRDRKRHLAEVQQKNDSSPTSSTPIAVSILYGIIQATILLPITMSFGNIIYHDSTFKPYLPVLVKLTLISSMVHQIVFSTRSSLPFAVGQVQDAGLIFLSAMATSMANICRSKGLDDSHLLATVTIGLSIFTLLLGMALVVIGRFNLATYVRSLPMPVVGGYLAFIGFFCGQSGLALMANVEISGLIDWYKAFAPKTFMLVLPGVMGGIGIYVLTRTLKHMAVLPTCIVLLLALFYLILFVTRTSVREAQLAGWINQAEDPPVWYKTWDYLQFDKVEWSALPSQAITFFSMIFVVALSSSLDVAAIELDIKRPLNYNHELNTVGISNIISGITGGYTGSYIFSQTILNLRAGIRSRLCGYVIALVECLFVVMPISILSYVPNFFFGSLLTMICVDLMYEWLWEVRLKVTNAEHSVALVTFVLIQVLGVEYGIFAGTIVYVIGMKLGLNLGTDDDLDVADQGEMKEDFCRDTASATASSGFLHPHFEYGALDNSSIKDKTYEETDEDLSFAL